MALCTYNGATYLREQLDSLGAQATMPLEIVVCDDGSSDGTEDIVAQFASEVGFPVKFLPGAERLGSTKNFQRAIEGCSGDIVALCDQDDRWHPEKLGHLVAAFLSDPALDLVFTDARLIDDQGEPTGDTAWECVNLTRDRVLRINRDDPRILRGSQSVTGATMAFRRSSAWMFLPFPEALSEPDNWWIHDGWIAAMCATLGRVRAIPMQLVDYRIHGGQQLGLRPPTGPAQKLELKTALALEAGNLRPIAHRVKELGDGRTELRSLARELCEELAFLEHRLEMPARSTARAVTALYMLWRFRRFRNLRNILRDVVGVA